MYSLTFLAGNVRHHQLEHCAIDFGSFGVDEIIRRDSKKVRGDCFDLWPRGSKR